MKYIILILLVIPCLIFAQQSNASLGISGGFEYKDQQTQAWNVELSYHDRINNSKRFWTEFGLNYSILEYSRDSPFRLDSTNSFPQITLGTVYCPGYTRNEVIHYSRSSTLRLQTGANYTVIEQEKFKLSAGMNLVAQVIVNHREHGQHRYEPINPSDSLSVIDRHYHVDLGYPSRPYGMSMFLQPHINARFLLADNLWFTSRFSNYMAIFSRNQDLHAQFNLGLRYDL